MLVTRTVNMQQNQECVHGKTSIFSNIIVLTAKQSILKEHFEHVNMGDLINLKVDSLVIEKQEHLRVVVTIIRRRSVEMLSAITNY